MITKLTSRPWVTNTLIIGLGVAVAVITMTSHSLPDLLIRLAPIAVGVIIGLALLCHQLWLHKDDAERHADDYKHRLNRQAIHHSIERDELRQTIQQLQDRDAHNCAVIAKLREQLGPNLVDLRQREVDASVARHPASHNPRSSRPTLVGESGRVTASPSPIGGDQ